MNKIQTPLADKIRKGFIDHYLDREHIQIANVSLVPNVDSTLLFVNSGMFPLVNYLCGEKHPLGTRLVNFQRCVRTNEKDLLEIGDWKHTTMFEMMGNWSLGDYFKKEQIPWVMDLYVNVFGLDPHKMYVSVFAGDKDAPRDEEAIELWKEAFAKHGMQVEVAEVSFKTIEGKEVAYTRTPDEVETDWTMEKYPNQRIFLYGKKENWWTRAEVPGEVGGPDSEIFYNTGVEHDVEKWGVGHPNSDSPTFIEIGNSVFIQYRLTPEMRWDELAQKNVDFGGGFARILMCKQGLSDIFATEIYSPIIAEIERISGKTYLENGIEGTNTRYFRIIADHVVAASFILGDGVRPSRKDQGYILRRFIRRAIRMGIRLGIEKNFLSELADVVIGIYADHYSQLEENAKEIREALEGEENKFRQTLTKGLKELQKISQEGLRIAGDQLFYIYETYGFPLELSLEELKIEGADAKQATENFQLAEKAHREQSRAGAEQKFAGGLADKSIDTTRLHTAHHLLLRALQIVLGEHVHQKGSNITAERLRIDFSHSEKLTDEQVTKVEEIVNDIIAKDLPVTRIELPKELAVNFGAEMEFGQKYGDLVSVYFVGDLPADVTTAGPDQLKNIFSKEFCGGPHVKSTGEIGQGGKFKIIKQESSGSGIRRIKASLI